MNDRKRAWQVLHNDIRRRAACLNDTPEDEMIAINEAWSHNLGTIIREAKSKSTLIVRLAGFGATFALMGRDPDHALALADMLGAEVMEEPDEPEDDPDQ
jgi:hypothetical protein